MQMPHVATPDEPPTHEQKTPDALVDETVRADPSLLVRACTIAGRLDDDTRDLLLDHIADHSPLVTEAEPGRIAAALEGLLLDDDAGSGLWAMVDSGLAALLIPELTALHLEQDPGHTPHKDILAHTIQVTGQTPPDLRLRLAALFHDAGKPRSRRYEGGAVTFHHHEAIGARLARRRLKSLGFHEDVVREVSELVALSGRFHGYSENWTDSAVRRYSRDAGPLLDLLNELVRSDCTTKNPRRRRALHRAVDHLEVAPEAAVALEDSPHGVTAASRAGLGVVAVPNEVTEGGDFSPADLVVDSLADVTLDDLRALVAA